MYSVNEIIDHMLDNNEEEGRSDEEIFHENTEEIVENYTENNEQSETKATPVKVKSKRRLNLPKLDAERLSGPKGLTRLNSMVSKLHFYGEGHEKEDLDALMTTIQYWSHRIFPKADFDNIIEQLEKVGHTRPVITLKRRIIEGIFDDEVNPNTENAIEESEQAENSTTLNPTQPAVTAEVVELTEEQKAEIARNRQFAIERLKAKMEARKRKEEEEDQSSVNPDSSIHLTKEQKQIIEKNRMLAIVRRQKNLNKSISSSSQQVMEMDHSTQTASNSSLYEEEVASYDYSQQTDLANSEILPTQTGTDLTTVETLNYSFEEETAASSTPQASNSSELTDNPQQNSNEPLS